MIGQIETQFAELKSMSDSINVDKLMADIKEVTSQAGDKAAAGIENATTLISAGLMKLEDLKTDAEKTEVLSMLQDKLADLDSTVREEILSSSNDIMKQFALIKELGENGSSMLADKVEEAKNIMAVSNTQPSPIDSLVAAVTGKDSLSLVYLGLNYRLDEEGGIVTVTGSGIPNGISLGYIASLSPERFYAAATNPNITKEGVALLTKAAPKSDEIRQKLDA